jgi:hypothetical protein
MSSSAAGPRSPRLCSGPDSPAVSLMTRVRSDPSSSSAQCRVSGAIRHRSTCWAWPGLPGLPLARQPPPGPAGSLKLRMSGAMPATMTSHAGRAPLRIFRGPRQRPSSPEHRLAPVPRETPASPAPGNPWAACNILRPEGELAKVRRAAKSTRQELERPAVFHVEPNISPSPGRRPPTIDDPRELGNNSTPENLRPSECASAHPKPTT